MHDLAIVGGTVVANGVSAPLDVGIENGVVVEVASPGALGPANETIDATGLHVLPGAVDVHFHCRAPSHPERGTFDSETRAAAMGGVTTVLEMPISKPPASTPEVIVSRRELGESEAHVDFGLFAGGVVTSTGQAEALLAEGAVAFKIFTHAPPPARANEFIGLAAANEEELYVALESIAPTGIVTTLHAENQGLIDYFSRIALPDGRPARPPIVESSEVALVGAIAEATGARAHIAHMTSAQSIHALRGARAAGADISGETCPHYLIFDESAIERFGSYVKVAPPLRPESDTRALWKALEGGDIQIVASDHAPFTPEEKAAAAYADAPQGLPAIETMAPVILDAAMRGKLTLERAVSLITDSPARRFGLYPRKGTIEPGSDADIVLWEAGQGTTLRIDSFVSKAGGNGVPYDGMSLEGRIRRTIVRGRTVQVDGAMVHESMGRFVAPARNN
jgi:allantoinase